jgi:hypothetical protein
MKIGAIYSQEILIMKPQKDLKDCLIIESKGVGRIKIQNFRMN